MKRTRYEDSKFVVIELLEDVNSQINSFAYRKGEIKIVYIALDNYIIANSEMEIILKESAKVIANVEFKDVDLYC